MSGHIDLHSTGYLTAISDNTSNKFVKPELSKLSINPLPYVEPSFPSLSNCASPAGQNVPSFSSNFTSDDQNSYYQTTYLKSIAQESHRSGRTLGSDFGELSLENSHLVPISANSDHGHILTNHCPDTQSLIDPDQGTCAQNGMDRNPHSWNSGQGLYLERSKEFPLQDSQYRNYSNQELYSLNSLQEPVSVTRDDALLPVDFLQQNPTPVNYNQCLSANSDIEQPPLTVYEDSRYSTSPSPDLQYNFMQPDELSNRSNSRASHQNPITVEFLANFDPNKPKKRKEEKPKNRLQNYAPNRTNTQKIQRKRENNRVCVKEYSDRIKETGQKLKQYYLCLKDLEPMNQERKKRLEKDIQILKEVIKDLKMKRDLELNNSSY